MRSKEYLERKVSNRLLIELSRTPSPDVVECLLETVWGQESETSYQHLDTKQRISELESPIFMNLRMSDRLIGTITLLPKNIIGDQSISAYYIRYFSIPFGKSGNGKRKNDKTSVLKEELGKSMDQDLFAEDPSAKTVYYAYIESDNLASSSLGDQFALKSFRKMSTVLFSRMFPKTHPDVHPLTDQDKMEVQLKLNEQYGQHNFFDLNQLIGDSYYVLKKNGRVLAGVKARKVNWKITSLDGFSGKIMMNLIPHIPIINRLFKPNPYQFLAFEGHFCTSTDLTPLLQLMESLLVTHNVYSGINWFDSEDEMYKSLSQHKGLGLLNKVKKDVPAQVVMRSNNLSADQIAEMNKRPVYISTVDLT